jgi:hypothetical protein
LGKAASELEDPARKGVASGIAFVSSNDLQGGEGGGGNWWGWSGAEDEGPAAVDEVLAESRTTGGKTAGGAEGLAQGPDQDVWRNAGLVTEAAPTRPQRADGVGLVDNKGCPVFGGQGCEVCQGSDVTVHTEERLGDDELPASGRCEREQTLLGRGEVEMAIEAQPGTREPAGIDNAGMVGVVAEDKVAGSCEGRKNAQVGLVSGGEEEHGLHVEEGRKFGLKFTVLGQIARYQARPA